MRELILNKLKGFISDADGYGIPRFYFCDEEDFITNPDELDGMTDEEVMEVYEASIGFQG